MLEARRGGNEGREDAQEIRDEGKERGQAR